MGCIRFLLFLSCFYLISCEATEGSGASNDDVNKQQLAATWCGSCHAVPAPDDLPLNTWRETILPRMGHRLGIFSSPADRQAVLALDPTAAADKIYPESPQIDPADWEAIQDYYLSNAPVALGETKLTLSEEVAYFQPVFPDVFLSPPSATMVHFLAPKAGYLLADANKKVLLKFDQEHQLGAQLIVGEGATAYCQTSSGDAFLSVIGSFSPTEEANGSVWHLRSNGEVSQVIDNLKRPTDIAIFDLENDGAPELIVSEFGKLTGRLAWWKKEATGWQAHVLINRPGATRVIPMDYNHDGLIDIISLFAQGDEQIMAFINQGEGTFKAETLVQFPPSYGSSSLDTLDWNDDGLVDFIYTNGDNADYLPILKPYHGVRIFEQSPSGTLTEELFLPLPGAYGATVADYNLDGKKDIAAISFFPDFAHQARQSFILFEQSESSLFTPKPFPYNKRGRWLRLTAGDLEGDGDIDLLTASLAFETVPDNGEVAGWVTQGIPYVFWENKTIDAKTPQ